MIGGLLRTLETVLGRGEAAVTVPPLDGALRPNRRLDEAASRLPLAEVNSLAVVDHDLVASAGNGLYALSGETWRLRREFNADIADIAAVGDGGLAVALATGDILVEDGKFAGRRYRVSRDARCITAIAADGAALYVANGSAINAAADWQLDLLQRNASGSVWRIDLDSGEATMIADSLAWPAGLAVDDKGVVFSEAWRHRLVRIGDPGGGRPEVLHADLPGYPGRLTRAKDGWWLAVFAPRSQLVEFVLREPAYRKRMVAEVARPFWIAPTLRSGRSFYEPLQGGAVKHLGLLKPWAPTMSAGLCVKLDAVFQPLFSLHSRADGATHGVTAAIGHGGRLYAAARGDGVVVSAILDEPGEAA